MSIFCISLFKLEEVENTVTEDKEGLVFLYFAPSQKRPWPLQANFAEFVGKSVTEFTRQNCP